MADKTLGAYQRHEKHDAADFAKAEFARHENGNIAVRGYATFGGRPWSTAGWVEYTDADMARDGWSPVRECPDPEQHDADMWGHATADGGSAEWWRQRWQEAADQRAAAAHLWKEVARRLSTRLYEEREWSLAKDAQTERLVAEAEKAERERDEVIAEASKWQEAALRRAQERDEERARADAAESRPLTPDAITDEMVRRAKAELEARAGGDYYPETIEAVLTAALTEPPARPEGAEELEAWFAAAWKDGGDWSAAADLFARKGLRAPTEDGAE